MTECLTIYDTTVPLIQHEGPTCLLSLGKNNISVLILEIYILYTLKIPTAHSSDPFRAAVLNSLCAGFELVIFTARVVLWDVLHPARLQVTSSSTSPRGKEVLRTDTVFTYRLCLLSLVGMQHRERSSSSCSSTSSSFSSNTGRVSHRKAQWIRSWTSRLSRWSRWLLLIFCCTTACVRTGTWQEQAIIP